VGAERGGVRVMGYDNFGYVSLLLAIVSAVGAVINYVLTRIAIDDKKPGYAAICGISGTLFMILLVAWIFSCHLFYPTP